MRAAIPATAHAGTLDTRARRRLSTGRVQKLSLGSWPSKVSRVLASMGDTGPGTAILFRSSRSSTKRARQAKQSSRWASTRSRSRPSRPLVANCPRRPSPRHWSDRRSACRSMSPSSLWVNRSRRSNEPPPLLDFGAAGFLHRSQASALPEARSQPFQEPGDLRRNSPGRLACLRCDFTLLEAAGLHQVKLSVLSLEPVDLLTEKFEALLVSESSQAIGG